MFSELQKMDVSQPLHYMVNDWFYMKTETGDICDPNSPDSELCSKNKNAVDELQTSTDNLGSSRMMYNDARILYNRELLFTVNILAGLIFICYYIYVNQSVIPMPTNVIANMDSIGNSISGMTSSVTSRLAMRPSN